MTGAAGRFVSLAGYNSSHFRDLTEPHYDIGYIISHRKPIVMSHLQKE